MGFFKKSTDEQTNDGVDVDGWLQSADEPSKVPRKSDDDMVDLGAVMADFTPPPPPPAPSGPFVFQPGDEIESPHRRAEDAADNATDAQADPFGSEPSSDDSSGLGVSEAPMWHFPDFGETAAEEADSAENGSINDEPTPEVEAFAPEVTFASEASADEADETAEATESVVHEAATEATGTDESESVGATNPAVFTGDDGELCVAESEQADVLLEILGVERGATWDEIRAARAELLADHDPDDDDPERAALAKAIRREMNTAYAALRLIAVP